MKELIKVKDLRYSYQDGNKKREVLKGINATFKAGKLYVIKGESGCGKTTLLSLIAGLDQLQKGDILFEDKSIRKIGYSNYREKIVNVVFQSYNLIPYMTALENIIVAIDISSLKLKGKKKQKYAYEVLEKVGINQEMANRIVLKLSGGEQQRVAIARSLAQDVPLIMADEPTGNLDEETEIKIIKILKNLAADGKCVIVVTHSNKVAKSADVVYKMKSGVMEKTK